MNLERDAETILESIEWDKISLERLQQIQSQISKQINIKISEKKLEEDAQDKIYYYNASAKVFPETLQNSLGKYRKCVFAISLGSKNFAYSERIEACIKWISKNFNSCVVLVGDSVYRLTVEVRSKLKGEEALSLALKTGQDFIKERRLLFDQYSGSCQFEFKMLSEIEKRSDFQIYYEELQGLYQKNESFQRMVNSFAQTYLNRGKDVADEPISEKQKYLATSYLLEESALFASVAKEGWLVFVYPGSIKSFEEIAEGLHPEVPEPLKQIVWVSLRLKKGHNTSEDRVGE
ncbi:MAG: tRNA-dependent cyclodipeptide synthase [Oscillatoria sp. SIO1A7]|nr:tRNA-dependent cyclodipeptide synthase [Oscillatoria sp. SIO1A7]